MPGPGEKTEEAVEHDFVDLARTLFGESLVSVTIYGSYLRDSFVPGVSDVNILVIVSEQKPEALRRLGSQGRSLMRRHRITPLVLSRRECETSADVFPMEYMDIVETHKVVSGPDVTEGLDLTRANLRHEIEHQLRGSLVSLRQLAVAAGRRRPFRKAMLRRELEQWYGSLSAILRGLLRLKGVTPIPQTPADLISAMNASLGLEPGPILQLLRTRKRDSVDSIDLIDALLERLTRLVEIVDSMQEGW